MNVADDHRCVAESFCFKVNDGEKRIVGNRDKPCAIGLVIRVPTVFPPRYHAFQTSGGVSA
jgi:hypothetical protein